MPVVHYNSGVFYAWIDGVLQTIPIGGSSPSNGLNSPLIIEKEDESFEPILFNPPSLDNVAYTNRANVFTQENQFLSLLIGLTGQARIEALGIDILQLLRSDNLGPLLLRIAKIDLLNGQISFPVAQDASTDPNTLDDYREENWTPTLTFGGGSTGITYDLNAGKCVKIGRLVLTSGRIFLTNKGSSTGSALINGLPFTISAGSPFGSGTPVCKFLNMASINNWFSVLSEDGTTTLSLWNGGAANTVTLTHANFTNSTDINFQAAYIASA